MPSRRALVAVTPATAVVVGKRTSVVTAKEYAAAAMASKAAEEDDMESVFIQITSSYLRFNFSPPSPPPTQACVPPELHSQRARGESRG